MALNPGEIGGDFFESIKDFAEGDIEIAGRKIPKMVLIGVGVIVILLLFVLRRGGGASASPFRSSEAGAGDSGLSGDTGISPISSESPIGGGGIVEGETPPIVDYESQITDLADLINATSQQQASDFQSQIDDLYGQLGQVANQAYEVPALPVDSGFFAFEPSPFVETGFTSYAAPVSSPVKPQTSLSYLDKPLLKPSNIKERGGTVAKLGAAVTAKSPAKVGQLGAAPKLSSKPVLTGILGFNKKPVVSSTPVSTQKKQSSGLTSIQKKQSPVTSPVKQTGSGGGIFAPLFNKVKRPVVSPPPPIQAVQKKPTYTAPSYKPPTPQKVGGFTPGFTSVGIPSYNNIRYTPVKVAPKPVKTGSFGKGFKR